MPVLAFLLALLAMAVALLVLGLAAERRPAVDAALQRIETLSHPQRGRLGVWLARDPRVPPPLRLLTITAFVYWVAPLDFIPDPLPRIGYLDDRAALALALWCVTRWAPGPLAEHLQRIEYLRDVETERLGDGEPS